MELSGMSWHDEIKKIIDERGIESLVHFTKHENLPSILKFGLVPRELCEKYGIKAMINDENRHEGFDVLNFTISRLNRDLFDVFRRRSNKNGYPYNNWIALKITPEILYNGGIIVSDGDLYDSMGFKDYEYGVRFHQHNAATFAAHSGFSSSDFEAMFAEEVVYYTRTYGGQDDKHVIRREDGEKAYFTTSPQAEITVRGIVPKDAIVACFFGDKAIKSRYEKILLEEGIDII